MLWDIVYDFFVMYIFGGLATTGDYYSASLVGVSDGENIFDDTRTFSFLIPFKGLDYSNGDVSYITFGNYLSLIATIITMVAILIICCALIKKIYNMCAHIIG